MTEDWSPAEIGERLDAIRMDPRRRWLATAGAVGVGLVLVAVHWLGFVVAGALVALFQSTIPRGLLAGLGFGVLSWLAFAAWLATAGVLDLYLGMGQLLAVSTVIPLLGSVFGALARGIR